MNKQILENSTEDDSSKKVKKSGLVLEGGGLRGTYTIGVLDVLLENDIEFDMCVGVSAGALNGISFISKQKKRSLEVEMKYIDDKRYMSIRNLIKTGFLFGHEMMFDLVPNKLMPFDYETFSKSSCEFFVVSTDCESGEAVYTQIKDVKNSYDYLKSTSSLPFVSKMIKVDGKLLLDGGLVDSIPFEYAIKNGSKKTVVVLTREKGYRKPASKAYRLAKLKYRKFPNLIKAIKRRYKVYNRSLERLERLEKKGEVFVIRPSANLSVSRFEKDKQKLQNLYDLGFADAKNVIEELKLFIKK